MAAFFFYALYDGLEGLRVIVARGRTAAFSFPSHCQTACELTALSAGRVSVHWPRCPRRLGPLL